MVARHRLTLISGTYSVFCFQFYPLDDVATLICWQHNWHLACKTSCLNSSV